MVKTRVPMKMTAKAHLLNILPVCHIKNSLQVLNVGSIILTTFVGPGHAFYCYKQLVGDYLGLDGGSGKRQV